MTMLRIPTLLQPGVAGCLPPQFAEEQHCRLLINCYAREVAMQEHTLAVLPASYVVERLTMLDGYRGLMLEIAMPRVQARLCVGVRNVSATANYDYTTAVLVQRGEGEWQAEGWEAVARLIIEDLSTRTNTAFNDELLQQIGDSIATMRDVLQRQQQAWRPAVAASPLQGYIDSEQSLITGHPFHPAPKSRSDWSPAEQRHYSPEHQARLALRYFQIPRAWVISDSVDAVPVTGLLDQVTAHGLQPEEGCVIVPLHPWQADWLAQQGTVAAALRSGLVRDLGSHGHAFHPTASVRTLLSEHADCFLKLSLNMRITNCIRNNARHELEGALAGTRLYRAIKADMQRHFPRFCVLEERAYLTVSIPAGSADDAHTELENGFGMLLREGVGDLVRQGVRPLICAALFGNGEHGRQHVAMLIERFAHLHGYQTDHAARLWFTRYAEAAVYPILYLLFEQGMAFEPHMQNTVIGLDADGAPTHVILRDLELTRLAPRAHARACALGLAPFTLEQLCCNDERAWTRIGYCLFVNNLCEVISTIANGNHTLYLALWGVLRNTLQTYLKQFPNPEASRRIRGLLAGEPLPAKGNLLTRFLRQADRHASYLPLYHPLGVVNGTPTLQ